MVINKKMLAAQMRQKYGYTLKSAKMLIDDFTEMVVDNLSEGNSVSLPGFGVFTFTKLKERTIYNVTCQDKTTLPAKVIPKFRASKRLKDMVADLDGSTIGSIGGD